MLTLYGVTMGVAEWKDASLALEVSLPFVGSIYMIACAWMLRMWVRGKADLNAYNACLAFTNTLTGCAVFVVMSWLADDTHTQRAWAFTTQMFAVVFGAAAAYANAALVISRARADIDTIWAGQNHAEVARAAGVRDTPQPPAAAVFEGAAVVVVRVGASRTSVYARVVTETYGRHLDATSGADDTMILPDDTRPMPSRVWVQFVGQPRPVLSYVDATGMVHVL